MSTVRSQDNGYPSESVAEWSLEGGFWGATMLHSLLGADFMDVFKFTNSSSTLTCTLLCVCILCFNTKFFKIKPRLHRRGK